MTANPVSLEELRRRAQAYLATTQHESERTDVDRLIHELEVHHTELEMQNLELKETHDLLEASRMALGKIVLKKESVDLTGIVRAIVEDHGPEFEQQGLELCATLPPHPLYVFGDATRLSQIVANLMANAQKFSNPGGKISVTLSYDLPTQNARLEVADTEQARDTGLMNRMSLDPDSGMIFVWNAPVLESFWMENTYIPLTVAFVAPDGTIEEMQDMKPLSTDLHTPSRPYQYAIEVNQGFFARYGIQAGDRVALQLT